MRTPTNERLTSDIVDAPSTRKAGQPSESERRCVLSGKTVARDDAIRLAISPTGEVLPDPGAKAPGRGAWIAPDRAELESAIANGHLKRALLRAFKGAGEGVTLSYAEELPDQIESALIRSLTDRLGLEMRGGNIVLGSSRIDEQARTGRIALLLHASDSSEDGRKKLDQAWRVGCDAEGSGMRGTVLPLDRTALSVALGRDNVVHLGVSGMKDGRDDTSRASVRVGQAITRLTLFQARSQQRPQESGPQTEARFVGSDPPD
ncbi:DUF448 domain-containing protein [Qipengyuania sp. ASV99]|uniref:DUF448 domain-containing protein n=1 Tax=Qipengyuania sp. ASV99 TaxID=3399681 RepID=UPI003A4C5846